MLPIEKEENLSGFRETKLEEKKEKHEMNLQSLFTLQYLRDKF